MGVSTWTNTQDQAILDGLKADQTYTQIASSLGVSKAMVSGRLYRLRKLRPDDVPEKKVQFIHNRRAQLRKLPNFLPHSVPHSLPRAGTLSPNMIARKNARIERSIRRDEKNAADRAVAQPHPSLAPDYAPVAFMALQRGHCTWCVEGEAGAGMMCCAVPVLDAKRREGDRRSTHCSYHYELSKAPRK